MPQHVDLTRLGDLSAEDRLVIVDAILATLEPGAGGEEALSEATKAELDRRIADSDRHPNDRLTWEQLRAAATEPTA